MNKKILYSPSEANEKLTKGDAILIDVRDVEDYEKGHIPGAVNIPEIFTTLSMTTPEGIQEMQDIFVPLFRNAGIEYNKTVIVYEDCLNTHYGGSCRGYFQLLMFGHEDVGIINGGLSQWLKEELPATTTDVTVTTPSNFEPNIQAKFLATLDDMIAAIENPNIKLLDNRDEDEWRGVSPSPYSVDFCPTQRTPSRCVLG
jgi:thiosulfate/3-mercaptopyruvate sulfurtransferase